MARPKRYPRLLRRAENLDLEVNLAAKYAALKYERTTGRIVKFAWWFITFRRNLIQNPQEFPPHLFADQPKVMAQVIQEIRGVKP
jgi:hypothetical protein